MSIAFEDSDSGVRTIKITGRMDITGTGEIELRFTTLAATEKRNILADLSDVELLASIGIRAIISNAKAQKQRGGKFVLFVGGNNQVTKTLETTGVDELVPMFSDLNAALAVLA